MQDVEGIFEVIEKLLSRIEALRRGEAHVVRVQRVRHHQLRRRQRPVPVGEVIRVGVRVVEEAALLGNQPVRVRTAAAEVPAQRSLARHLRMDLDCFREVRFLGCLVNRLVVDPAVTVTRNLPARFLHCGQDLRVTLQRHCDAEYGNGKTAFPEQPVQSPETGTRSVFIERLHIHVTLARVGRGTNYLREERLGCGVSMQHTVLCTLLVVNDELHGGARTVRPGRIGWLRAVATQIAWIVFRTHSPTPAPARYQRSIRRRSSSVMLVRLPIGMTRVTTVW